MEDIDDIFNECMNTMKELPMLITASMVKEYVKSPFNLWCNLFAPESEKDTPSEYYKLLNERGIQHETVTIQEMYPDAQKLEFKTLPEGFKLLLGEFAKGTGALTNMPMFFKPEGLMCKPDIVQINDSHKSIFGDYHYIVAEIKSAKNIDQHPEHIMQAALNNYVIGKIQGYIPNTFFVVNRDKEVFSILFKECEEPLQRILMNILEIINGKEVTPTVGSVDYPWENYGLKKAKEIGEISLVPELGEKRKSYLSGLGIRTVKDLAKLKLPFPKVQGISSTMLSKMQLNAQAILENKVIILSKPSLPTNKTEIYLDFESTDESIMIDGEYGKVDYLIGVLVVDGRKETYIPFFSKDLSGEGKIFKGFLDFIKGKQNFVIYHYHHYEKTRLQYLFEKYGKPQKLMSDIFANMIDLAKVLKESVMLPIHSQKLKDVAKYLGFSWRGGEIGGRDSIALFFRYLEDGDKSKLDKLIDYNEDDCKATKVVKDFLSGVSLQQST